MRSNAWAASSRGTRSCRADPLRRSSFETNSEFSDQDFPLLKSFVELTTLDLSNTKVCGTHIKGAGLAELRGLKKLVTLSLWSSQISDAGLKQLQDFKSLTTLILAKTEITDAGLMNLSGLTGLTTLSLDETEITDAGLKALEKVDAS